MLMNAKKLKQLSWHKICLTKTFCNYLYDGKGGLTNNLIIHDIDDENISESEFITDKNWQPVFKSDMSGSDAATTLPSPRDMEGFSEKSTPRGTRIITSVRTTKVDMKKVGSESQNKNVQILFCVRRVESCS